MGAAAEKQSMAAPLAQQRQQQQQQLAYLLTNLVSACAIVFANKAVLSVVRFRFTVALTCIHTVATWLTARVLCRLGIIKRKPLPRRAVVALAGAFAGYIVLCNVSLQLNTVGFYQLTKIAIAPTVLVLEAVAQRRRPALSVTLCVLVVCAGIALATVFDTQVMTNLPGLVVGLVSVAVSAQYGMWIGSMTKQHGVMSMQLLEQYLPYASLMMAICVPFESLVLMRGGSDGRSGFIIGRPSTAAEAVASAAAAAAAAAAGASTSATSAAASTTATATAAATSASTASTLLTFNYTPLAVGLIALSAVLGVLVTFSTFLVIGNTSPLTYAVAGHAKTIVILGGGVLLFGDRISRIKALGLVLALGGVIAYTRVKMAMTSTSQGGSASQLLAGKSAAP
jgi:solute carrier family 35, member E3